MIFQSVIFGTSGEYVSFFGQCLPFIVVFFTNKIRFLDVDPYLNI